MEGKKTPRVENEVQMESLFVSLVAKALQKIPGAATAPLKYKPGDIISVDLPKGFAKAVVKKAEAGMYLLHVEYMNGTREAIISNRGDELGEFH